MTDKPQVQISDEDLDKACAAFEALDIHNEPGDEHFHEWAESWKVRMRNQMRAAIEALHALGWRKVEPDQFVGKWRKAEPSPPFDFTERHSENDE